VHADLLGEWGAELEGRAIGVAAVGLVTACIGLLGEEIAPCRNPGAEKIRLRSRQIGSLRVLFVGHGSLEGLAGAHEVVLAPSPARARHQPSSNLGDRKFAGRSFGGLDIERSHGYALRERPAGTAHFRRSRAPRSRSLLSPQRQGIDGNSEGDLTAVLGRRFTLTAFQRDRFADPTATRLVRLERP
jgi:hypothetical protein